MHQRLTDSQVDSFVTDGYVRIDAAFSGDLARAAREILWRDLGLDPRDPTTWTQPVVRLGMYTQAPFIQAANTERLHGAFDTLVGPGKWLPCRAMGTFPVRFPSNQDPGDSGWHVDAGFPGADAADFMSWRVDVRSRGRALLMLFLFSDVGEDDAPTRIRVGSHRHVARLLAPHGSQGLSFTELAGQLDGLPAGPEVSAIGEAGTVYLCHPFLVHAATPHRGHSPRFMAQPPLFHRAADPSGGASAPDLFGRALDLEASPASLSPVGRAIRHALDEG